MFLSVVAIIDRISVLIHFLKHIEPVTLVLKLTLIVDPVKCFELLAKVIEINVLGIVSFPFLPVLLFLLQVILYCRIEVLSDIIVVFLRMHVIFGPIAEVIGEGWAFWDQLG